MSHTAGFGKVCWVLSFPRLVARRRGSAFRCASGRAPDVLWFRRGSCLLGQLHWSPEKPNGAWRQRFHCRGGYHPPAVLRNWESAWDGFRQLSWPSLLRGYGRMISAPTDRLRRGRIISAPTDRLRRGRMISAPMDQLEPLGMGGAWLFWRPMELLGTGRWVDGTRRDVGIEPCGGWVCVKMVPAGLTGSCCARGLRWGQVVELLFCNCFRKLQMRVGGGAIRGLRPTEAGTSVGLPAGGASPVPTDTVIHLSQLMGFM